MASFGKELLRVDQQMGYLLSESFNRMKPAPQYSQQHFAGDPRDKKKQREKMGNFSFISASFLLMYFNKMAEKGKQKITPDDKGKEKEKGDDEDLKKPGDKKKK